MHTPVPGLANIVTELSGDRPLVVTYHAGTMKKGRQPIDAAMGIYERTLGRRMLFGPTR
jgi:hypothetical protein